MDDSEYRETVLREIAESKDFRENLKKAFKLMASSNQRLGYIELFGDTLANVDSIKTFETSPSEAVL